MAPRRTAAGRRPSGPRRDTSLSTLCLLLYVWGTGGSRGGVLKHAEELGMGLGGGIFRVVAAGWTAGGVIDSWNRRFGAAACHGSEMVSRQPCHSRSRAFLRRRPLRYAGTSYRNAQDRTVRGRRPTGL